MDDVEIRIDMTVPQQIVDSLRETSRFLAARLAEVSPEHARACAEPIAAMAEKLRPEARLMIEEIVALLAQEEARQWNCKHRNLLMNETKPW